MCGYFSVPRNEGIVRDFVLRSNFRRLDLAGSSDFASLGTSGNDLADILSDSSTPQILIPQSSTGEEKDASGMQKSL
jgi:hypothetical protein